MKSRPAPPTSSKPGASSHIRAGRVVLIAAAGLVAAGRMVMRRDLVGQAKRREPDAATNKMFTNIHRNRTTFSATELNKAFAKAKAEKVG